MTVADVTRVEFSTPADFAECSYRYALDRLWEREDVPVVLLVNAYDRNLARHIAWNTGWKTPVQVHPDLRDGEWLLCGERFAVHSAGA